MRRWFREHPIRGQEQHVVDRPVSGYQRRRQDEERLGSLARFLSVLAAVLYAMVTVEAAGYPVHLPFLP